MQATLKKALLYTFQALLVLVPLTWTSSTSELFEFPKMLLTYAGAAIIGGLWVARMIVERKVIFKRTPFELPLLLFLLTQTISTVFSIHPHTSTFGYYSRFNGGLLSLLSYSLLYFAAVSNFTVEDAKKLIKTLVATAAISSLYAFPEHFGHSPSCAIISGEFHARCWVQDVQSRIFGTFGQPNWLAAYLVVLLPVTIFSAVYNKRANHRFLYLGFTLLILLTILFTKSQSGLGATALVLVLSFIVIALQKKRPAIILGLIPLFALLFITKQASVLKTLASLNNINPLYSSSAEIVAREVANRIPAGTDSMIIRRIVWEGAWKLALTHPLIGTGVETFAYTYYNVRPVEHNMVTEWDFLYNKAHNEFLNYAATTGFLGLGAYIWFLGAFLWWARRHAQVGERMVGALATGFIALCVSNFFGFSTVPVNTLLFLIPGLAFLLDDEARGAGRLVEGKLSTNQVLGLWVVGIGVVIVLYRIGVGLAADMNYAAGRAAGNQGNYTSAAKKLQQAFMMVPTEAVYADELSVTASEVASQLHAAGRVTEASQAAQISLSLANKTLELNPIHLNFYKTRSKVFINLASIDPRYAVQAGVSLDQAFKLAPTDAKLWYNRAILTYQLGFKEESLGIYQKTIELRPNYELARLQYAKALESLGKYQEAREQYAYILENLNPGNVTVEQALSAVATKSADGTLLR